MKASKAFAQHRDTIRRLVLESGMANPRLFGSVLHGDEIEGSDLDILVDAGPRTSLLDIAKLQVELEEKLGLKVDLRTPEDLHPRFRNEVLAEATAV